MENQRILDLLNKYQTGRCTGKEKALLESWYLSELPAEKRDLSPEDFAADLMLISNGLPLASIPVKKILWPRLAAAVAVLIFLASLLYYNLESDGIYNDNKGHAAINILPGKNGATLTLSDGKKIRLEDLSNGSFASEAGISINKSAEGQIIYKVKSVPSQLRFNTLETARGETYQVRLPDGSSVWLNAASKLTFATTLQQNGSRRVILDGEGYFEVAKDKAHPFLVESRGQLIEVLGTHFNVNAYRDEAEERTTLLEGSVMISQTPPLLKATKMQNQIMLTPGQQASISANQSFKVNNVNAEDAIAWKEGLFIFNDEPLESIMKKIARWYNVEIIYSGSINKRQLFGGGISRFENVYKVLEKLELTGLVHFKIEGRNIIVTQ